MPKLFFIHELRKTTRASIPVYNAKWSSGFTLVYLNKICVDGLVFSIERWIWSHPGSLSGEGWWWFSMSWEFPSNNLPIPGRADQHRVIGVPTTVSYSCSMMLQFSNLGSTHLQFTTSNQITIHENKRARTPDWHKLEATLPQTWHVSIKFEIIIP